MFIHADHFISLKKTPTKNKRFHHIPISRYSCTCSISSQCRNRQDLQKKYVHHSKQLALAHVKTLTALMDHLGYERFINYMFSTENFPKDD